MFIKISILLEFYLNILCEANQRFIAYDSMLEMLGKRVFALEDTLQKALDKVELQDNKIKQLAHAQLICGCRNDQAARISGQKPDNAGVNLFLELGCRSRLFFDKNSVDIPVKATDWTKEKTKTKLLYIQGTRDNTSNDNKSDNNNTLC